jgi:hypothetical protein
MTLIGATMMCEQAGPGPAARASPGRPVRVTSVDRR